MCVCVKVGRVFYLRGLRAFHKYEGVGFQLLSRSPALWVCVCIRVCVQDFWTALPSLLRVSLVVRKQKYMSLIFRFEFFWTSVLDISGHHSLTTTTTTTTTLTTATCTNSNHPHWPTLINCTCCTDSKDHTDTTPLTTTQSQHRPNWPQQHWLQTCVSLMNVSLSCKVTVVLRDFTWKIKDVRMRDNIVSVCETTK